MGDMYMVIETVRRGAWVLALGVILGARSTTAMAAEPIKVGMVAALSGQSAKAGEGITRGLTIAIDEINKRGGVLGGRRLELVRRDDESNPSKGQVAALELIHKERWPCCLVGLIPRSPWPSCQSPIKRKSLLWVCGLRRQPLPEWCQSQLCLPGLGGGRPGG